MSVAEKFLNHYASVSKAYEGCSLVTTLDAGLHEAQYTVQELEADKATLLVEVAKLTALIAEANGVVRQYERMLESAQGLERLQDKLREQIENGQ